MKLHWFYELDSLWVVLVLMVAMMLAAEISFLIGRRRGSQTDDPGKGHFNAVQGSLLGLLALLLAFTFSVAAGRYETRRQLTMDDASALAAVYQWSSLLPEPPRREFKGRLRQYVDLRTDSALMRRSFTPDELAQGLARAEELHRQMWDLTRQAAQGNPPVKEAQDMLPLLNATLSVQQRRVYAYQSRVPGVVLGLLFGAALIAMCAVGYSGGLSRHRGMLARVMMILLVCGTIYVILDLEQPRRGFILVDQSPLVRVRQIVDHDPEAGQEGLPPVRISS
jgi:hypothetical protein